MASTLTLEDHQSLLSKTIVDKSYIFLSGQQLRFSRSPEINKLVNLYFPYKSTMDSESGIAIKGGGYIRAHEVWDLTDKKAIKLTSYSYNLYCPEYKYSYSESTQPNAKNLVFNFRYEKNKILLPKHPQYHLQVLHEIPRYKTEEITFYSFMQVVEDSFFENGERLTEFPWFKR